MGADLRLSIAVLAGRTTARASRRLGRGGGTTLPGDVARALDRRALSKITAQLPGGVVLVTGTNGKTTTTGVIVSALQRAGRRVMTNASGANLIFGMTAAAVAGCDVHGRPRADLAVFEADELVFERAVVETRPRMVVVLNFMRDQLDRSGELQTTAARVGRALRQLRPDATVIANVDDPHVWAQCEGVPGVVAAGIESDDLTLPGLPHAADARNCPRCEAPLIFERVVLAHCGKYRCPNGDFARPALDIAACAIVAPALDALGLDLTDRTHLDSSVGGVYNAYNLVVAYAALRGLGLTESQAAEGIAGFRPRFGRQERMRLHGRDLAFLLAKNPSGFDEVLRTADDLGHTGTYLIALNDNIADGRDVSWIWDVDFERLARSPYAPRVVLSGRRARDLAVRMKYAGVPADRVTIEPDPARALAAAAALGDPTVPVAVLPTYTAMLALRAVAQTAGAVDAYWTAERPGRQAR